MKAILCVAVLSMAVGCEPTCKNTCEKLLECDDTTVDQPRVSVDECEDACEAQQNLYAEDWENQQLRDELGDYKSCVMDNECEDIADGACFNPNLQIF